MDSEDAKDGQTTCAKVLKLEEREHIKKKKMCSDVIRTLKSKERVAKMKLEIQK